MAGQYFNDPRVFYDITGEHKLSFLDDMFGPGKKENKFIESEYRVKEGKQGGGGGNNSNQKKKKNNNEDQDEHQEQKKKVEEGGGGGNNSNQKKKKNNNEDQDEHQEQKKKVEEKSKIKAVELNVSLCCDRCAKQVKEALEDVEGVEKVECDQINRKVWVKGSVKPEVVLKKVRKLKKDAELVVQKKQN